MYLVEWIFLNMLNERSAVVAPWNQVSVCCAERKGRDSGREREGREEGCQDRQRERGRWFQIG